MIAAYRSEWIKLGRRNFILGGFGTIIGLAILLTILGIVNANADPATVAGPPGGFAGGVELESAAGWLSGLGQAASFIGIVALALFAANIAGEFSTGSIRVLLTTQPRRLQFLNGKILALGAFLALAILYASVASAAVAFPLAAMNDIDTTAWRSTEAITSGLALFLNVTLAAMVYGLFGIMLGMITRSSAISIAAGVAYFLLGETLLLQPLWDQADQWLPAGVLNALITGGNDAVAYTTALALAAIYAAITWGVAVIVLQRRDIVD